MTHTGLVLDTRQRRRSGIRAPLEPAGPLESHTHGRGFTLLEVLVAVALLGVALVSLLGLHARDIRLAARAQDLTVAGLLAARIAADTRTGVLPELGTTSGEFSDVPSQREIRGRPYGGPLSSDYVWQQTVEPTGLLNLRRVRIGVGRPGEEPLAELDFLVRRTRP